MAGTVSKRRPPAWGKEKALEIARAGPVKAALKKLAGPLGLSWKTLYRDTYVWKRQDPEFAAAWAEAMSTNAFSRGGGAPRTAATPEKLATFLRVFAETLEIGKACEAAGISPGYIYQLTDDRFPAYNKAFAEEYEKVYQGLLVHAHDVFPQVMFDPEEDGRTRVWAASRFLERRDRARFGRRVDVAVSGKVDHSHSMPAADRRALEREAFTAFFDGVKARARLTGAVEGDVVEGEAEEL